MQIQLSHVRRWQPVRHPMSVRPIVRSFGSNGPLRRALVGP